VGAAINPEWQILAGHVAFLIVLPCGRAACFRGRWTTDGLAGRDAPEGVARGGRRDPLVLIAVAAALPLPSPGGG
jgi:hypothetical protein